MLVVLVAFLHDKSAFLSITNQSIDQKSKTSQITTDNLLRLMLDNHSESDFDSQLIVSYGKGVSLGSLNLHNGKLDKFFWEFVPSTNIDEFYSPDDSGWVKSLYDDFYIYFAFKYYNKATWIAVEFNAKPGINDSMYEFNDGWILRKNNTISFAGDIYYNGNGKPPSLDNRNDIDYESILDNSAAFNYFELRRPLNTLDTDGFDVVFELSQNYSIKFASNSEPKFHVFGDHALYYLNFSMSKIIRIFGVEQNSSIGINTNLSKQQNIDTILFWEGVSLSILAGFSFLFILIIRRE